MWHCSPSSAQAPRLQTSVALHVQLIESPGHLQQSVALGHRAFGSHVPRMWLAWVHQAASRVLLNALATGLAVP